MTFECKGLEDRVNDIESSIADFTDLTNGKLDKTAVVQETGAGTDVVMSQKAVTDTLNEKLTRVPAGSDSTLYGESPEGSINVPFKNTAIADTIAQRTAGGQLKAADGVEEDDLATVKQLNVIANKGLDTLTNVDLTAGNTTVQYDPTSGIQLSSTARFTDGAGNHDAAMGLDLPIVGINGIAIGKAVDSEKVEIGLDDTQKIRYVELAEGQALTTEQLDILRANKNNQIVYTLTDGLTSYYFRMVVDLHNGEWLYESCNDSTVTLRVNLVRGNVTFTKVGGGLDTIKKGTGKFSEVFNYDPKYPNKASGSYSHAEGYRTEATGNLGAHAEGYSTHATGNGSHAEGQANWAQKDGAHAEGYDTRANAYNSHTEGFSTSTTNDFSHAEGMYNIDPMPESLLHVIGIGDSSVRKDGFEVYSTGEVWCKGPLYVGGVDDAGKDIYQLDRTKAKEVATKEYVDSQVGGGGSGGGGKLYQHVIKYAPSSSPTISKYDGTAVSINGESNLFFKLYSTKNTALTSEDINRLLTDTSYIPGVLHFTASQNLRGAVAIRGGSPKLVYGAVRNDSDKNVYTYTIAILDNDPFTDTVTEL